MADLSVPAPRRDLRRPSPALAMIGPVLRPAIHRFGRLTVTGREQVPEGGAVLVSNHVGWMDPVWIAAAAWPRPVFFMAKKELFVPVFGRVIRTLGAFPIDRQAPGPSALKVPLAILRDGGLLVIFPGGTRSAELGQLKRGAATIAALAKVPVVPARYRGPSRLRAGDLLRRPPVSVEFLTPIRPEPGAGKEEAQRLSAEIKARLDGE